MVLGWQPPAVLPQPPGPAASPAGRDALRRMVPGARLVLGVLTSLATLRLAAANPDAKRLYDDLLSNYNRLIRWRVWLGLVGLFCNLQKYVWFVG